MNKENYIQQEQEAKQKWQQKGIKDPYISKRVYGNGQPSLLSEEQHQELEDLMNKNND